MKLGNNRRTIVVTMSLMLVAGGVAFLALGASAHREGAFLANLKDLINGISGGNEQLSNLDTYIESEVSMVHNSSCKAFMDSWTLISLI